jgi:hypothetical protein
MTTIEIEREVEVGPAVTKRDVLHRAADLLEEFGWCQKVYGSKAEGAMCAAGAVGAALVDLGLTKDRDPTESGRDGLVWLWDHVEIWTNGVGTEWNDTPGRTKAEVIQALRESADGS